MPQETTVVDNAQSNTVPEKKEVIIYEPNKYVAAATIAGNVIGLVYAFKKNSGFLGYVGYMLLGGIVLGGTVKATQLILKK